MSEDHRRSDFWQGRYQQGKAGWDKGEAAPPLKRAFDGLDLAAGAKVLVPGCGYGHEAVALAEAGYEVTAVDFAPAAIARLREKAEGLSLTAVERDIFTLDYTAVFGLVVEHTCFCAIPLDCRDVYAETMARALEPGGRLLGLFWELGDEDGPPYNTSREDLQRHFSPHFDIVSCKRPGDSFPGRQDEEWLVEMVKR